jgi:hypothetical protein
MHLLSALNFRHKRNAGKIRKAVMLENYFVTSSCGKYSRDYFKHSFRYSIKIATCIIQYGSKVSFKVTVSSVQNVSKTIISELLKLVKLRPKFWRI